MYPSYSFITTIFISFQNHHPHHCYHRRHHPVRGVLFEEMQQNPADGDEVKEGWSEGDLLPIGGERRHPLYHPDRREYVVTFEKPEDCWNPQNWTSWKKWTHLHESGTQRADRFSRLYISTAACCGTFVASFNSAIFAAGAAKASNEFDVGKEVTALGTSLFVLGFASGPLIWGPGSELIGRRWPLCIGMFGSSFFTIGCAAFQDIQTLIICRFFAGLFGVSPLCVVPAVLSDLYSSTYRGMAISVYTQAVFGGPFLAPVIGEFIAASYMGWRWTLYLPAILRFSDVCFLLLFSRETFPPLVLVGKAIRLRRQTGNRAIYEEQERLELDIDAVIRNYLTRPLRMLATEPIVLLVSVYMSYNVVMAITVLNSRERGGIIHTNILAHTGAAVYNHVSNED